MHHPLFSSQYKSIQATGHSLKTTLKNQSTSQPLTKTTDRIHLHFQTYTHISALNRKFSILKLRSLWFSCLLLRIHAEPFCNLEMLLNTLKHTNNMYPRVWEITPLWGSEVYLHSESHTWFLKVTSSTTSSTKKILMSHQNKVWTIFVN